MDLKLKLVSFAFFIFFVDLSAALDPIQLGFSLFNEKKFAEAEEVFQVLLQDENPYAHDFAHLGMGKIALEEGDLVKAEKELEKIGNHFVPSDFKTEWFLASSELAFKQGKLDQAEELLLSLKPASKIDLLLAEVYLKKGALQLAEEHFRKCSLDTPIPFLALLGKAAYEKGLFSLAATYFQEADLKLECIKALIHENTSVSIQKGFHLLDSIVSSEKIPLQAELLAKCGQIDEAINLLKKESPSDKNFFLIGSFLYEDKRYEEAHFTFNALLEKYPNSSLKPDTLFWLGKIPSSKSKSYFQSLYEQFPDHRLAAEAYFNHYPLQEYLLGNKSALKHLRAFKERFPKSPFLLHAFYLEGLDLLRDRKSPEGKWISRQNLTAAIDAFQSVETLFNTLEEDQKEFTLLRDYARLERAKANLSIAKLSKPAKKAIYCDYAEELFHSLISNFSPDHPLLEESLYYLALTESELGQVEKACATLSKIQKGYYFALALYQKGVLKQDINTLNQALEVGDPFLSNDEKLTIMLEKANYYQKIGALDDAMLQLSELVNSETASSLRLKAMFQRAEIYKEQGRYALAQKQLESIALKGGDWAEKAKEKLEKEYGYQ